MHTTEKKAPPRGLVRTTAPALRLLYAAGEVVLPPRSHRLRRGEMTIGREVLEPGLCLAGDRRASRVHARVSVGLLRSNLHIADAGSTNGTQVNGRAVTEAHLADGDVVGIGDSLLLLRDEPLEPRDAAIAEIVGVAPLTCTLRYALHRVAPTPATVLLLGESGTGKEVAARALHRLSGRGGPFVAVNCGAIPAELAESQLFGHVQGAFTGAAARPGFFRAAHGGTLFLDEIGELPPALQPKLLRVIEERAVTPVGAVTAQPCEVRLVAATNRDLVRAVAGGSFRGDLYARICEVPVTLPPLRARREDVLLLLVHALGPPAPALTPALAEALVLHDWPYNVREVFKVATQLRLAGEGRGQLELEPVLDRLLRPAEAAVGPGQPGEVDGSDEVWRGAPPDREQLVALLRQHCGVVSDVARALGRSRRQVHRWIAQHGIDARALRASPRE